MATIIYSNMGLAVTPSLSELMGQLDLVSLTSTKAVYKHNEEFHPQRVSYGFGFTYELTGTNFTRASGQPTGTITGMRILDESGNVYATITPGADSFSNASLQTFNLGAFHGSTSFEAFEDLLGNDDLFQGGAGNDMLHVIGGPNFDTLSGGGGDDFLLSGFGTSPQAAHLDGGTGVDRAFIDRSQATVGLRLNLANTTTLQALGDGTKIVNVERINFQGGSGNDTIAGGALDDEILGGAGRDRLSGNGGADALQAQGSATMLGGAGDDFVTSDVFDASANVSLDGGAGLDVVVLNRFNATAGYILSIANPAILQTAPDGTRFVGFEQIRFGGGSGNDRITGGALPDLFSGGAGNNVFNGGGGEDFLSTDASGRNTYDGGAGSDAIDYLGSVTAAVSVTLKGADNATVFVGGVATDVLRNVEHVWGGGGNDTLIGDGFDNRFIGGGGKNVMRGGAGNDAISSGNAGDTLDGGAGTGDLLLMQRSGESVAYSINLTNPNAIQVLADGTRISGFEQISVSAGNGDDVIVGGDLDDSVFAGGDFNDTTRKDSFNGRGGFDTMDLSSFVFETDITIVLRGAQGATVLMDGRAAGTLTNVEAVLTNGGNDNLIGDALANQFVTSYGNDSVSGGGGDDTITAGGQVGPPDRDTIQGGAGRDSLAGGIGIDTAIYSEKTTSVRVTLNAFEPVVVSVNGVAEDTIMEIENITGGKAADRIIGDVRSNALVGNGGNDTLDGGDAIDRLSGDAGNDSLAGGAASDTVSGGAGNDTVNGGAGADRLSGGLGIDRFVFDVAGWGGDIIADFEDGVDKLSFKSSIADNVSDFTIGGNGTENVTLKIGIQTLSVRGESPITLSNADFLFLA